MAEARPDVIAGTVLAYDPTHEPKGRPVARRRVASFQ